MENKQNIKDLINKFYPHAKEKLGFDHPVRVIMRQDAENAQQSLGKTAYYDPAEKLIVLYVTDRHPKDVLRSFSHELVHHAQNCRGELDDLSTDAHYAKDGKGREIEEEAYLQGNLNLRDYEDIIKYEGVNEMKLTKSQLKGIIEATVKQISEGKMPMKDEPEGKDLNKDGKRGSGKVPAFLGEEDMDEGKAFPSFAEWFKANRKKYATTSIARKMYSAKKIAHEKGAHNKDDKKMDEQEIDELGQQMDMPAIENVMAELRELSDMDSSASRNLQRMGQEQFFRVLADKLERAMEGQVASSPNPKSNMGSGELEEDVDEMHCGGKRDDELEEQEEVEEGTQPPEEKKDDKTAKFLDDMIKKRIRKKAHSPRSPADLVQPVGPKLEENNDAWYNSNLFESLVSKWTKEGDK